MFAGFEMSQLQEAERPRGRGELYGGDRFTGELFSALRPRISAQHPHVALPLIRALRAL